jgi:hypothetical protein
MEYMKINKNIKDINAICASKNKTTISANQKLSDIYYKYHDRDDGMLYLMALTANPFGG